jgi:hypothetical protein
MSDAERRRRLAAVYRRLIKLAQQDRSPDIPAEAGDKEPNSQFDFGCSSGSSGES